MRRLLPIGRLTVGLITGLTVGLAVGLGGCGYQLGGHDGDFAPMPERVSVKGLGQYESLRKTLVGELRARGARVVAPSFASVRVMISGNHERQKQSAIGDDAKAREYLLFKEVTFSIIAGDEKPETSPLERTVHAEATYLANPARPLLAANEKRAIVKDMEIELSRKIIRIMLAILGECRSADC